MGQKSKQTRSDQTLQFLNWHKEKFDWDNEDLEIEEGLVEDEAHPDLPAEIPGVPLESDFESDVIEQPEIRELDIAIAAARNANLADSSNDPIEITGVNPPVVIDDNGSVDTATSEGSDGDVQFIGENLDPPNRDPDQIHEVNNDEEEAEATTEYAAAEQDDEIEAEETPETNEKEASVRELGRERLIKKKPKRLIEDENWGLRHQRGQNHTCLHDEV